MEVTFEIYVILESGIKPAFTIISVKYYHLIHRALFDKQESGENFGIESRIKPRLCMILNNVDEN